MLVSGGEGGGGTGAGVRIRLRASYIYILSHISSYPSFLNRALPPIVGNGSET